MINPAQIEAKRFEGYKIVEKAPTLDQVLTSEDQSILRRKSGKYLANLISIAEKSNRNSEVAMRLTRNKLLNRNRLSFSTGDSNSVEPPPVQFGEFLIGDCHTHFKYPAPSYRSDTDLLFKKDGRIGNTFFCPYVSILLMDQPDTFTLFTYQSSLKNYLLQEQEAERKEDSFVRKLEHYKYLTSSEVPLNDFTQVCEEFDIASRIDQIRIGDEQDLKIETISQTKLGFNRDIISLT